MVIAFLIWSVVSLLFFGIGIWCFRADKPVGFFAGVPGPEEREIRDVPRYNRAVGKLWIVNGLLVELCGLPLLFGSQNSPVVLLTVLVVPVMIGMMIAYFKIEQKYRGKKTDSGSASSRN